MDKIYSVNGPVVKVADTKSFAMQEMVYVGKKRLIGEVIRVQSDFTTIQVYEGTTGLMPDEPVISTGAPMSATLGPGIINNIFDGIERPLKKLEEVSGAFIADGADVSSLDTEKKYPVTMTVKTVSAISVTTKRSHPAGSKRRTTVITGSTWAASFTARSFRHTKASTS